MNFCTGCGAEIPEDSNFCNSCGKPQKTQQLYTIDEVQSQPTKPTPEPTPIKPTPSPAPTYVKSEKKATRSIVGIVLGLICIVLSFFHKYGFLEGAMGAIVFAISVCSPKQLNFCPTCGAIKDFEARRCPHCGKPFHYGAERAAGAALLGGGIIFFLIFSWV